MPFDTAIQTALNAAKAVAGGQVTYRRGDQSNAVAAVRSHPQVALDRGSPATVIAGEVDWIIQRADLTLAGVEVTPEGGDLIEEEVDDLTYTYEVTPTGGGNECEDLDPCHLAWRIHSKLTEIA